jgi:hypothetical protein
MRGKEEERVLSAMEENTIMLLQQHI